MRISTGLVVLSLLSSGGAALAQPAETPAVAAPNAPVAAPGGREVTSTGTVRPETPAAAPAAQPDGTGPDVVNGLEVPRMKNPNEGGRQ